MTSALKMCAAAATAGAVALPQSARSTAAANSGPAAPYTRADGCCALVMVTAWWPPEPICLQMPSQAAQPDCGGYICPDSRVNLPAHLPAANLPSSYDGGRCSP